MANEKTAAWYAERYVKNFGLHLVPIEPKRKFPRTKDWGEQTLSDPVVATAFYNQHPDWNMGVALGASRMCALDIDCLESFSIICDALGIDLPALIKDTPTIVGDPKGRRLEFRVPHGVELPYVKLNWRPECDPTGELYKDALARAKDAKANGDTEAEAVARADIKTYGPYTVFELRSATDGSQKQNVYPPSVHPDTGEPYTWVTQPRKDWPTPPEWLLTIWQQFDRFRPQLAAACPWAITEELYKPKPKLSAPQYNGNGGYQNVVSEYNNRTNIEQQLQLYGYKRVGKRWLSPNSSTGLPGVVLFPDNRAWIHHASDPLCSDESGHPVSPFDLACYNDFGGDFKRAVTTLAEGMGIRVDSPRVPQQVVNVDPETGEVLSAHNTDEPPCFFDSSVTTSEPHFVDTQSLLPWRSDRGKPFENIENLTEIINRLGCTVRYNVIKKEIEILAPNKTYSVDNQANASLAWLISECSKFNYPTGKVDTFITPIADQNQYNPVATWINSKPWDGTHRLADFMDTVSATKTDLKNILIKRWMLSAIDAVFNPNGVYARGVLVFQGSQEMGKTRWLKRLAPPELSAIHEGHILRPEDKDSVKIACSHWLVELGELDATFKRSDMAQLKGFITKTHDTLRLPFAKRESSFARRTVFFGSVNPREFLNDPTGNTRFWTVECTHINHDHDFDMQQVWAELYEFYYRDCGERHMLTDEESELLNHSNEDFRTLDPIEEMIMKTYDWEETNKTYWRWSQATEILLASGFDRPTRSDTLKASQIIRKLNGDEAKRMNGKRVLLVPPVVSISNRYQ